ncbi:hypothetical protein TSAR_011572 [Trichomalopsis sarcophagae]|uniref:Odorant receptor n=1 Tax=Trichomalopsis sarcophagae TaxID=543379 RepID=A0A232EK79_9HYME|nr:hypothetical protein TSAR_011572 [Trichomalopsis sarcophagae]
MEIFDSRYFIINKTCMKLLGLWPYSSHVKNYLRRCGLGLFLLSCYLPQVRRNMRFFQINSIVIFLIFTKALRIIAFKFIRLYMYFGEDMDEMIQNIGVILYVFGTSVKLITGVTAEDRMKIVYEKTARDFQTIVDKEERNILFEYSERGRTLSITFIIYMWIALAIYVGLPMGPLVLDYFIPLQNGSRERGFVWKGEYLVDPHKYYFTIYAVELFSSVLSVAILSSVGPMYQAIVEHCLGLFAIVKFRLQICTRGGTKAEEETYRLIVKTIRLHNDIIEFTRIIEASYTSYFFIEMGITISLVTLISVNVSIFDTAPDRLLETMLLIFLISRLDYLFDSIRHILILLGVMIHMFYLTWPSQKMINHSTDLFHDTYSNEWYNCSIRCQNLLKFMALRCVEPSQLTARGLYVMNFENYASVLKSSTDFILLNESSLVKTSASYITVLLSFR